MTTKVTIHLIGFLLVSVMLSQAVDAQQGEQRVLRGNARDAEGNPVSAITLIFATKESRGDSLMEERQYVPVPVLPDGSFLGKFNPGSYELIGTNPPCYAVKDAKVGSVDHPDTLNLTFEWSSYDGSEKPKEEHGGTTTQLKATLSSNPFNLKIGQLEISAGRGLFPTLSVGLTQVKTLAGGVYSDSKLDCDRWMGMRNNQRHSHQTAKPDKK